MDWQISRKMAFVFLRHNNVAFAEQNDYASFKAFFDLISTCIVNGGLRTCNSRA